MSTFHAVVWMDHSEAHVVMFDREHMEAQRIRSRSHHKHQGKTADNGSFFGDIARALSGTHEVLLAGPQTVEEAIPAANETYVEGGGKDNEREAAFALRNTLRALKHIGLVAQSGKDITVVGKVVPIKN